MSTTCPRVRLTESVDWTVPAQGPAAASSLHPNRNAFAAVGHWLWTEITVSKLLAHRVRSARPSDGETNCHQTSGAFVELPHMEFAGNADGVMPTSDPETTAPGRMSG